MICFDELEGLLHAITLFSFRFWRFCFLLLTRDQHLLDRDDLLDILPSCQSDEILMYLLESISIEDTILLHHQLRLLSEIAICSQDEWMSVESLLIDAQEIQSIE